MRGIVVFGVVLTFLLSGERLWGDTPESPGTQKSRDLLAPGQPAPDFVAHDADGTSIALRDYQGRPVIINFWATWCAPCRQEMRALQTVYEAHKTAGLAVLAVSQDQQDMREAVRAYCATVGITFLPLLDPDGSVLTAAPAVQPKQASFDISNAFTIKVPEGAKRVRVWFAVPQGDTESEIRALKVEAPYPVRYGTDSSGHKVGYLELNQNMRAWPLFPVTVLGSLPRPQPLLDALRRRQAKRIRLATFDRVVAQAVLQHRRPEQIYLNPDCGFGTFAERPVNTADVAAEKLRAIHQAAEVLRAEYA